MRHLGQLDLLVETINVMAERMDVECFMAKDAVRKIKPDLEAARVLVREADTTIKQLAELVDAAVLRGVVDATIADRVMVRYHELGDTAKELLSWETVLAARQNVMQQRPKALN